MKTFLTIMLVGDIAVGLLMLRDAILGILEREWSEAVTCGLLFALTLIAAMHTLGV